MMLLKHRAGRIKKRVKRAGFDSTPEREKHQIARCSTWEGVRGGEGAAVSQTGLVSVPERFPRWLGLEGRELWQHRALGSAPGQVLPPPPLLPAA